MIAKTKLHIKDLTQKISTPQPVLSRRLFDWSTDSQGSPTLLHLERFEVPAFTATKELHLMPHPEIKSWARPFRMKTTARLSWRMFKVQIGPTGEHKYQTFSNSKRDSAIHVAWTQKVLIDLASLFSGRICGDPPRRACQIGIPWIHLVAWQRCIPTCRRRTPTNGIPAEQ